MATQVLFADDSATMRRVVEITFAREDVKLTLADSGRAAVAKAKEVRPDLAIVDIGMEDLDGYAVCQALKADPATASIPVLLLSSKHTPYDEGRAQQSGAASHVVKPFETQVLVERALGLVGATPNATANTGAAAKASTPPPSVSASPTPSAKPPQPAAAAPGLGGLGALGSIFGTPPGQGLAPPVATPAPAPAPAPVPSSLGGGLGGGLLGGLGGPPANPVPANPAPAAAPSAPPPGLGLGLGNAAPGLGLGLGAARPAPSAGPISQSGGVPAPPPGAPPPRPAPPAQSATPGAATAAPPAFAPARPAAPPQPESKQSQMASMAFEFDLTNDAVKPVVQTATTAVQAATGQSPNAAQISEAAREIIEKIAWEVVPTLAEAVVREHLERLLKNRGA